MDDFVEGCGIHGLSDDTRNVLAHIDNYKVSRAEGCNGAKETLADVISKEQVEEAYTETFDKWAWDESSDDLQRAYKELDRYRKDKKLWELRKLVKIHGCPLTMEPILTEENIDQALSSYWSSIENIGLSATNLKGLNLFHVLKREKVGVGPYPHVTLFEAANRIMTDLVILHGVKWLLDNHVFPFDAYVVEYGNEDNNSHDITAENGNEKLAGEAFNVAQSFFQGKKGAMLKKLGTSENASDYKIIMANSDSVDEGYSPNVKDGEYYVFVDVQTGEARVVSNSDS